MSSKYLERIASEIKSNFNGNFNVINKNMAYPIQSRLFPGSLNQEQGLRVKLGRFYEILTQGIYGGNIKELQKK